MRILFLATNLFFTSVVVAGRFDGNEMIEDYIGKRVSNQNDFDGDFYELEDLIKALETFLDGEEIEKLGYFITEIIRASKSGLVVHAINNKSEKFMITIIETDEKTCDEKHRDMNIYEHLKKNFEVTGVLRFSGTPVTAQYQTKNGPKKQNFCLVISESLLSNLKGLSLSKVSNEKKVHNTKVVSHIILSLLKNYSELHSKAFTAHNDISLQNIFVVPDPIYGLEPKITNFYRAFSFQEKMKNNLGTKEGTLNPNVSSRAPELKDFCEDPLCKICPKFPQWITGCSCFDHFMKQYKYSKDFKEDAFALGKMIQDFLNQNDEYILKNDGSINLWRNTIIPKLMRTYPENRWSTTKAYSKALAEIPNEELSFKLSENELKEFQSQVTPVFKLI